MPKILMPYTVHLDHTLRVTPVSTLFYKGDSNAHRFELNVLSKGLQADLSGCTAVYRFYRLQDSTVVSNPASIESGKVVAVLDKACYDYIGRFALTIAIQNGEDETTVFYGDGYMSGNRADTGITGDYVVYDVETLLAKIAEIETAIANANTAIANANTAAENANAAEENANAAASGAQSAAGSANEAARTANTAAGSANAAASAANKAESSANAAASAANTATQNANAATQASQTQQQAVAEAEAARDTAEQKRATAEQARQETFAGFKGDIGSLKNDLDSKAQFGDPYDGVDLTVKHAKEIEDYASPWSWIKARIAAGNFSQLHVGDYIPFTTTNGRTFQAQIAGINTYKGYGNPEVGNHIDFITRELWPDTFQMNLVNFNNGTSDTKQTPWLASNGYLFVNSLAGQVPNGTTLPLDMVDKDYTAGGMYFYLPDDLKAVIVEKRVWAQARYSASGVLTNDNAGAWANLGKLWLPDEYEVTGARLMTTTGWFCGGYVQYPIFAGNMNRLKRANGSRIGWWLSSAGAGNSIGFVSAISSGLVYRNSASGAARAPFCFRIS